MKSDLPAIVRRIFHPFHKAARRRSGQPHDLIALQTLEPRLLLAANWGQDAELTFDSPDAMDGMGRGVAISGDWAVVAAPFDDTAAGDAGAVYVYRRHDAGTPDDPLDDQWLQAARLTASDAQAGDQFGSSLSIDGTRLVVGAMLEDDRGLSAGAAYVFEFDGLSWNQQAKLTASDGGTGDQFGVSVDVKGQSIIIGAHRDDDRGTDAGAAYVYEFDGAGWSQRAKLLATDGGVNDNFGFSVAMGDDHLVVGAWRNDDMGSDAGAAYIYSLQDGQWLQAAKLTGSSSSASDHLGYSVDIDGLWVAVGSPMDDDLGFDSGAVYLFTHDGSGWIEAAKLTANDGLDDDDFGWSVSLSGGILAIGAFQADGADFDTGAAYVFALEAGSWSQAARLATGDAMGGDLLGYSVGTDGAHVILGALWDDSHAPDGGSAYIFGQRVSNQAPIATQPIADITLTEGAARTVIDLADHFLDAEQGADLDYAILRDGLSDLVGVELIGTLLHLTWEGDDGQIFFTVIATDAQGESAELQFTATLLNAAPIAGQMLFGGPSGQIMQNSPVYLTLNFTDPGLLDTHDAVIDWDDGTQTPGRIEYTNGVGRVIAQHVYAQGGVYNVRARLVDDDGGVAEIESGLAVSGVGLRAGVLTIIGTAGADVVSLKMDGKGMLRVQADFLPKAQRITLHNPSGIDSILIMMGDGNDKATLADSITLPALMLGEGGDDELRGGSGDDLLIGGDGDDELHGNAGDDWLQGGDGNDRLRGGNGDDTLDGGDGDDNLRGMEGNDLLRGGAGDDELSGGEGDDILMGMDGCDSLHGNQGDDQLDGGAGNDKLSGDEGDDLLLGGDGDDLLRGGQGMDRLYGEAGDDELYGGDGQDLLSGGDGDDFLSGGNGNDALLGGAGNDLLRGGAGDDLLLGMEGDDILLGEAGDDRLLGGGGDDLLAGGQGDDTLIGGGGNDRYKPSRGRDILIGNLTPDDSSDPESSEQLSEPARRKPIKAFDLLEMLQEMGLAPR